MSEPRHMRPEELHNFELPSYNWLSNQGDPMNPDTEIEILPKSPRSAPRRFRPFSFTPKAKEVTAGINPSSGNITFSSSASLSPLGASSLKVMEKRKEAKSKEATNKSKAKEIPKKARTKVTRAKVKINEATSISKAKEQRTEINPFTANAPSSGSTPSNVVASKSKEATPFINPFAGKIPFSGFGSDPSSQDKDMFALLEKEKAHGVSPFSAGSSSSRGKFPFIYAETKGEESWKEPLGGLPLLSDCSSLEEYLGLDAEETPLTDVNCGQSQHTVPVGTGKCHPVAETESKEDLSIFDVLYDGLKNDVENASLVTGAERVVLEKFKEKLSISDMSGGSKGERRKVFIRRLGKKTCEANNVEMAPENLTTVEEERKPTDEDKPALGEGDSDDIGVKTWDLRPRKPCQRPKTPKPMMQLRSASKAGWASDSTMERKDKQPKGAGWSGHENAGKMNNDEKNKDKNADNEKVREDEVTRNEKKGKKEMKEKMLSKFPKLSLGLTSDEIEEDIFAMTGKKAARRPIKRRDKNIQRQIDQVLPGSWLESITPDSYKVPENAGEGK